MKRWCVPEGPVSSARTRATVPSAVTSSCERCSAKARSTAALSGADGAHAGATRSASSRKHLAVTVRRSRRVSRVLPLHGARGEAADVLVYEEGVDQSDRHRAEERARHERPPEVDVTLHELGDDADRDRLDVGRVGEDERVNELVPREREGKYRGGEDAGERERQDDLRHRAHAARAVDERALLELARDAAEVTHEQPRAEHPVEGEQEDDRRERERQVQRQEPAGNGRGHTDDRLMYTSKATTHTISTGNM